MSDFPDPGARRGWPWTASEDNHVRAAQDDSLPRITVVTPSYNQGEFIEETIRSVVLQGYPNLEYLIMDGGSTDDTVEIIRKYEPWITDWVSEPDRGQTHAINKGLERATGEIFAYMNSDDLFEPGSFMKAAEEFQRLPEAGAIYGRCRYVGRHREELFVRQPRVTDFADYLRIWERFIQEDFMTQPEVFCRTAAVRDVGGFREDLRSVMDFEMWLRLLAKPYSFHGVDQVFAEFRSYGEQKSTVDPGDELAAVVREYLDDPESPISDAQRVRYRVELKEAHAQWLVRGAISALDEGYRPAVSLVWRAVQTDAAILGRYETWAVLGRPLRSLLPGGLRDAVRRGVQRRRARQRDVRR